MTEIKKKYLPFIFAALVLLGNVNFAFSQSLCGMKMEKSSCCESSPENSNEEKSQTEFSKPDCCKQVFKEIKNTSEFSSTHNELNNELISTFILSVEESSLSHTLLTEINRDLDHSPPKDLLVLNSIFRI